MLSERIVLSMSHLLSVGPIEPSRLSRVRLEGWLAAHPPRTVREFADRVFARSIQLRDDVADADLRTLLLNRHSFLVRLDEALEGGAVASLLLDALRLCWVFRRHGIPRRELEDQVRPYAEQILRSVDAWREPERSVVHYWAGRLGWCAVPPRLLDPDEGADARAAALLLDCDYGETPIERRLAPLQAGLLRLAQSETDLAPSATLIAEALLVETALKPPIPERLEGLAAHLIALQQVDGGFVAPEGFGRGGRHHAACLALVALSRAQAVLPKTPADERKLG